MWSRSAVRFAHKLPPLPYELDALKPYISAETLQFHYGKHHAAYVTKLNQIIATKPSLEGKSLEELLKSEDGPTFNQAAQVWNHNFYWNCLKPGGSVIPSSIESKIKCDFGSLQKFEEEFNNCAIGHFGSGWAWLVLDKNKKLKVESGHDAENPLKNGNTPILTCDVWEHAYYVDYRNDRAKYLKAWWALVNWDFANSNLQNKKSVLS